MIDSDKMESARKRKLLTALDNLEDKYTDLPESSQLSSLLEFFYDEGLPLTINISDNPLVSRRFKLTSYPEGCWADTVALKPTIIDARTLLEGLKMLINEFLALDLEYIEETEGFGAVSVVYKPKSKTHMLIGDVLLYKYMKPKGLGIPSLAKKLDIPEAEIGHIVFNAKNVDDSIASKLATYFGTAKDYWTVTKPVSV